MFELMIEQNLLNLYLQNLIYYVMDNTKQRRWVTLSSGVKVGLPTDEETQIMRQMKRSFTPIHKLRQDMEQKKESQSSSYEKSMYKQMVADIRNRNFKVITKVDVSKRTPEMQRLIDEAKAQMCKK